MIKKNEISNLPVPSVGGLSIYLAQIKKFPMLDAEEEYMLAKNWKENGNLKAAHKLVTSHLRLINLKSQWDIVDMAFQMN